MTLRTFKFFLLFCLLLFLSATFAAENSGVSKTEQAQFLCLSDIHFDPFTSCTGTECPLILKLRQASVSEWKKIFIEYGDKPQQYRQDTSYELLNSTLLAAKKIAEEKQVKFILILGDFLGHDLRKYYIKYAHDKSIAGFQTFIRKTMQFLTVEIKNAFPTKDIYSLIGNNDSNVSDYYVYNRFYNETANSWSQFITNRNNKSNFLREFPLAGYYAVNVPNQPNLRLILMNTVLFSKHARGKGIASAADVELKWLQRELQVVKANHQKAIIAMHIPTGIDVYTTLRMRLFTLVELWQQQYTKQFQEVLEEFATDIVAVFAGHLHSDWFQILTFTGSSAEIPVTGVPSVSPLFGNNPSFQVYTYSQENLKLTDYLTYYTSLRNKKGWDIEYNFNHIYLSGSNEGSLLSGIKSIKLNNYLAEHYKNFYSVGTRSQPIADDKNWKFYWCAIQQITPDFYKKCMNN